MAPLPASRDPKLAEVLVALLLERLVRLKIYLEKVSASCSDAELRLVKLFEMFRDELLRKLTSSAIAVLIRPIPQGIPSEQSERSAIDQILQISRQLDTILVSTGVFPRGKPLEVTYFFIRKCFPHLFDPNVYDLERRLAVVLWPIYNFGEEDFGQNLGIV